MIARLQDKMASSANPKNVQPVCFRIPFMMMRFDFVPRAAFGATLRLFNVSSFYRSLKRKSGLFCQWINLPAPFPLLQKLRSVFFVPSLAIAFNFLKILSTIGLHFCNSLFAVNRIQTPIRFPDRLAMFPAVTLSVTPQMGTVLFVVMSVWHG